MPKFSKTLVDVCPVRRMPLPIENKTVLHLPVFAAIITVLLVVWLLFPFLLFHTVIELSSIFIGLSLYHMGSQSYRFVKDEVLLFISIGFLYVAMFDGMHTLAYKGMALIPGATINHATQLWLAGRILQILTLLLVPFVYTHRISRKYQELYFLSIGAILSVLIITGYFPTSYVDGVGMTTFKKVVEYILVSIALMGIIFIGKLQVVENRRVLRYIRWALGFLIASELSFTLYKDTYDVLNGFGHVCKLLSYGIVWSLVLDEGFSRPYEKMFREMYDNSIRDQLTGLYNRRFFESELELSHAKELRQPLAVAMADVNGLKLINDTFGHKEGDCLIQAFAEILKQKCRDRDITIRLGGDEFLIVFQGLGEEEVETLLGDITTSFAQMESCGIPYSVSIGYAIGVSGQDDLKGLQLLAEERMYHQKLFSSPKVKDKIIGLAMAEVFRKSNRDIINSEQVGEECRKIALALDFCEDRVAHITMAGRLHDIGKIRLSTELLNKIEPLDDADWRELRRHPEVGYAILSSVNDYAQLAEYVLHHHERWDGNGYPLGLSGEDIPLESRIIAVADAYQAMVTDRPNRKRMTPAEAKTEIACCAGTQFDPSIATLFVNMP